MRTKRSRTISFERSTRFRVEVIIPTHSSFVGTAPQNIAQLNLHLEDQPDDLAQQHGLAVWSLIREHAGKPTNLVTRSEIGAEIVTARVRPLTRSTAAELAQTLQQHCTISGAQVSVVAVSR